MCIATIPQDTLTSTRNIVTEWKQHLKPTAAAIVDFILRRTVQFGKEWEAIPERHFLEGVISRAGKLVTAGINISRATFHRWLAWLQCTPDANGEYAFERRLVIFPYKTREHGQAVFSYRINPKFNPATMLRRPRASKAREPEPEMLGGGSQFETGEPLGGSQFETTGGLNLSTYKGEPERENLLKENSELTPAISRRGLRLPRKPIAEPALDVSETISPPEAQEVVIEVPHVPARPNAFRFVEDGYVPPKPKDPVSDVEKAKRLWITLETEYVTNSDNRQLSPVMPWGAREYGMMKVLIGKWKSGGGTIETFLELIRNSLPRWVEITASMNINLSLQPSLGLFVSCFTGFRDYEHRITLLREKQERYQEVMEVKRAALKQDRYAATGELDKADQRELDKEARTVKKEALGTSHAARFYRDRQQTQRERLLEIDSRRKTADYDDDGMPIVSVADYE